MKLASLRFTTPRLTEVEMKTNRLKRLLFLGLFLVVASLIFGVLGPVAKSLWLTQQYGLEMRQVVQKYRETEFALATRLQPELILSVAAEDYLPTYLELNRVEMCQDCDRFWVVASAEVREIRILEYTSSYSKVWAKVITWGHRVNSKTYEPLATHEAPLEDEATYTFVWDQSIIVWKLKTVEGFSVPSQ